jgi:histidinol-phosphate aminotransferase
LANPNSPMGEYKFFDEIKPLLEYNIPVLIDEAYIEFSDSYSIINEINNYSNLLITRTFSKGLGAAGCRVGMVFSNENNIELISKFSAIYEISGVSMKYCEFLIDNYSVVNEYIENVKMEKRKILFLLDKFEIIDSSCNWIHINDESDNIKLKRVFDKYKVLARYCSVPHDNRKNWCRLSIVPSMSKFEFFKEVLL